MTCFSHAEHEFVDALRQHIFSHAEIAEFNDIKHVET